MAAAAAELAVHKIVKEAVDLGIELNSLYKAFKNQSQHGVGDVQRGASHLQVDASQVQQDGADMKEVEQAMKKVIDSQASLLALLSQGPAQIYSSGMNALHLQVHEGFDSLVQAVQDESAIWAARQLKAKLGQATLACNRMVEGIVAAAENQQRQLTPGVRRDIAKAEHSATELFIWAKSFVPSDPGAMTKHSKLQTVPYIVTMAFAARVQAITHILERDMMEHECDQITCLKRARTAGDDFMAVLERALEGIMVDTSLLEVATVYQLPMAMYLTLMTSFRASMDELLQSPDAKGKEMVVWDDGLAPIRNVLHWKASDAQDGHQGRIIELNSRAEWMWWATFTDTNLEGVDSGKRRIGIHIRELCHVLGAGDTDHGAELIPGQKSALLQLPPASVLRAALCANIAQAHQAIHADRPAPAPPPPSFARINTAYFRTIVPRTLAGHTSAVYGVAVCPDGEHIVSGSCDGTVRLWSLSSGQQLRSFSGHTGHVLSVAVSPDGETAVSGSEDKSVRVWSLGSGSGSAKHTVLQGHSCWVWAVAVSPDGRSIASGSADMRIKLWNAESGQCQATLTGHSHNVICVAFSPDGATLVSGSDDMLIRVWNVSTGALERSLRGHSGSVTGVAVTPDGRRVVSGSHDKTVKVWSLSSGAEEMRFEGHGSFVSSVAVFPDGRRIASSSWDSSVRVWNLRSKALEVMLMGCGDYVICVAVSGDGRSVVSGSEDTTIQAWALSGGDDAAE